MPAAFMCQDEDWRNGTFYNIFIDYHYYTYFHSTLTYNWVCTRLDLLKPLGNLFNRQNYLCIWQFTYVFTLLAPYTYDRVYKITYFNLHKYSTF